MRAITFLLAALLLLGGCREDPSDSGKSPKSAPSAPSAEAAKAAKAAKAAEAARVETEVVRRVAVVEHDLKVRQTRLHTIRLVGFIVLVGGAVAGLMRLRQPRFPDIAGRTGGTQRSLPPLWSDHVPPRAGRVIESLPVIQPVSSPRPGPRPGRQPNPRHRKSP